MEEYRIFLDKAEKHLRTADHIAYITYSLLKDKRLLIKILDELYNSVLNIMNAVLQYEYIYKRINLYKDSKANFRTFREKCAPRFGISEEQLARILEIFSLMERHKQSPMEFMKQNNLFIMSNGARLDTLNIEKIKDFIFTLKEVLKKASERIGRFP